MRWRAGRIDINRVLEKNQVGWIFPNGLAIMLSVYGQIHGSSDK